MIYVAVTWYSSDVIAICYVLPVLRVTSCFCIGLHVIEQRRREYGVCTM